MPFLEFHPWVLHLKRSSNTESSFGVGSSRAKANFSFTRYCENCKLSPVSTAHEAPESLAYWVLRSSQLCPLIGELFRSEYCLRLCPRSPATFLNSAPVDRFHLAHSWPPAAPSHLPSPGNRQTVCCDYSALRPLSCRYPYFGPLWPASGKKSLDKDC